MTNNSVWNVCSDPISTRLRDDDELRVIQNNKTMIYHEPTKTTALIMDIWIVEPLPEKPWETTGEDRYVRYTTENTIKEEFSIDLDDDGWLWFDELTQEEL